jgi:arsenite methyltransferase
MDRFEKILAEVGFRDTRITLNSRSRELVGNWFPGSGAENYVASADIEAVKPL